MMRIIFFTLAILLGGTFFLPSDARALPACPNTSSTPNASGVFQIKKPGMVGTGSCHTECGNAIPGSTRKQEVDDQGSTLVCCCQKPATPPSGPSSTPTASGKVCQGQPFSTPASPSACTNAFCGGREAKWEPGGYSNDPAFRCCCLRGAGGGTSRTRSTVAISCPPGLICLGNPLGLSVDDANIPILIGRVLRMVFGLIGTIALVIFIYGGALWMTAFGEEAKVKRGWDTMIWGAIGLVVIFGSYVAVEFILKAILGS